MRFPDIPLRHRRLVRAIAVAGTSGLALVRRRDFAPEHDRAARLGNAIANAGLTWIAGTRAFAGPDESELDLGAAFGAVGSEAGQPARYSTVDPMEQEERTRTFRNLTTAFASGALSWALWHPTQDFVDRIDAKFPAGFGRGLGAGASGAFVAGGAALLDKFAELDQAEYWENAPVEIELPEHIRGAVDQLLAQPHPVSAESAEAVRAQFDSARFFVWVTYSRTQHPGDDPITLDPQQLSALLDVEDITTIDVYPEASARLVVPKNQTYPVTGVQDVAGIHDAEGAAPQELRLEIADGLLSRIDLNAVDEDSPARSSDDLPGSERPGMLYPLGLDGDVDGYLSRYEMEDEEFDAMPLTLDRWPGPKQLRFISECG
ncbi:hypothetical protein [Brevibacterium sp. FME17]|uniref:hypothetical protein n=1 Tax=Brevibacterium sp. FME17 TaxID=2742606 RepID=UPI000C5417D2|nr:hypothetical protein [Brevibacterium sp. FME17]SMX77209.1 hypothetical protein BSP239C_01056 [Brevibacterium sp. 239c]